MKIAIIGAGISGLVAAWHLWSRHEITIFEASSKPGGHTNTVPVEVDGESHTIDTGFIVYNEWTYPRFIELLSELNVETRPTVMGFSVSDEITGLEYAGNSLNALFAQRINLVRPRFYRLIADIIRFNREGRRLDLNDLRGESVGEFLTRRRYSEEFARQYLLPMGAAIWSCPLGTFADFPVQFILEFYRNHGLLNLIDKPTWRVIAGGSETYVEKLTRPFRERLRLNTPIQHVRRNVAGVTVVPTHGESQLFDHVIFACHSDQALRILGDQVTATEQNILGEFPYVRNEAVLHTDTTLLPRLRRTWASWNYRLRGSTDSPASLTYNMNLLQGISSEHTFCVTLNDSSRIDPKQVLGRFEYHHPVFTTSRSTAQLRHHELLGQNQTSFCGAYWGNGFHEDGVVSALAVVKALERNTNFTSAATRPEDHRRSTSTGADE